MSSARPSARPPRFASAGSLVDERHHANEARRDTASGWRSQEAPPRQAAMDTDAARSRSRARPGFTQLANQSSPSPSNTAGWWMPSALRLPQTARCRQCRQQRFMHASIEWREAATIDRARETVHPKPAAASRPTIRARHVTGTKTPPLRHQASSEMRACDRSPAVEEFAGEQAASWRNCAGSSASTPDWVARANLDGIDMAIRHVESDRVRRGLHADRPAASSTPRSAQRPAQFAA